MPDSRQATARRSLVFSAGLFALADWIANSFVSYAEFSWNRRTHGWSNKALTHFEIDMASEAIAAFVAGLIVLLSQVHGSISDASRRYTLLFSAAIGVLFCIAHLAVDGIASVMSLAMPASLDLAIFIALATAASFAIYRFRWGNRDRVRRGFPILTSSQTLPSSTSSTDSNSSTA